MADDAAVAAAKAEFKIAFAIAENGEHAALAPVSVASSYLADDEAVATAKAKFNAAFAAAEAGEHAALAPTADKVELVPVASSYLADTEDVAAAKAKFAKYFAAAEAGVPLAPEPVEVAAMPPKPVVAKPAVVELKAPAVAKAATASVATASAATASAHYYATAPVYTHSVPIMQYAFGGLPIITGCAKEEDKVMASGAATPPVFYSATATHSQPLAFSSWFNNWGV